MTSHYTHRLVRLYISSLFKIHYKKYCISSAQIQREVLTVCALFPLETKAQRDQESKVNWRIYGVIGLGGRYIIWSHREQIRIIKRKWRPLFHVQGPQKNWLPASVSVLSSQPGFDLAESLAADSAHAPSAWFILAPVGPSWGKAHLGMFNTFPCQAGERAALAEWGNFQEASGQKSVQDFEKSISSEHRLTSLLPITPQTLVHTFSFLFMKMGSMGQRAASVLNLPFHA